MKEKCICLGIFHYESGTVVAEENRFHKWTVQLINSLINYTETHLLLVNWGVMCHLTEQIDAFASIQWLGKIEKAQNM